MRNSPPQEYTKTSNPNPFTSCFIVDYLDLLGMKRKIALLSEYCDIDDMKYLSSYKRKFDPLKDM
jgi:hypothetical protein